MSRTQPKTWTYRAVVAKQSPEHTCVTPQIASHIREIRDYLAQGDAVLPNLALAQHLVTVVKRGFVSETVRSNQAMQ